MKLNLSIEGKVLSSIMVDAHLSSDDYYLKAFRRMLAIRCRDQLMRLKKEPQFSLEAATETGSQKVKGRGQQALA